MKIFEEEETRDQWDSLSLNKKQELSCLWEDLKQALDVTRKAWWKYGIDLDPYKEACIKEFYCKVHEYLGDRYPFTDRHFCY